MPAVPVNENPLGEHFGGGITAVTLIASHTRKARRFLAFFVAVYWPWYCFSSTSVEPATWLIWFFTTMRSPLVP